MLCKVLIGFKLPLTLQRIAFCFQTGHFMLHMVNTDLLNAVYMTQFLTIISWWRFKQALCHEVRDQKRKGWWKHIKVRFGLLYFRVSHQSIMTWQMATLLPCQPSYCQSLHFVQQFMISLCISYVEQCPFTLSC